MATKTGFVMLALLIPGPHKVRNMDIYLEPLIEELEILWRGIQVHDVSRRPIAARDTMVKGILMWTMHDYRGYSKCSSESSSYHHVYIVLLSLLFIYFLNSKYYHLYHKICHPYY